MKEFGGRGEGALKSIKAFFGNRYADKDGEKFVKVLSNTDFPEIENCEQTQEEIEELCAMAEEALNREYPAGERMNFGEGIVVRQLGRPRVLQDQEWRKPLAGMCEAVCRTLSGYDEALELSVIQNEEEGTVFRLVDDQNDSDALTAMIRSVYSRVKTEKYARKTDRQMYRVYAGLNVLYRDSKQEEAEREKEALNWVDAVIRAFPAAGNFRVDARFVPLASHNLLLERQQELQEIADRLKIGAEVDWNHTDTLGISHRRENNLAEKAGDVGKGLWSGRENISGNYGAGFGWTRHQKNKRAELLAGRIDQMLYRIGKAVNSRAWRVELSVASDDDYVLQSVCSCLSGTLQKSRYILSWGEERRTAAILSAEELMPLMRFPTQEFAGFEFVENEEFSLVSPAEPGEGMRIGQVLWNGFETAPFDLPGNALNRHAFICGMTGAGKTNTLFNILEKADVPFLVIEPVKGEYRSLSARYPDIRIRTMKAGNQPIPNLEILRINPFWFPENSSIAFHVDSIKTIIASAFEMSNAMPNILEQCMYNIYIKAGWNIITNKNRYAGQVPGEFLYPTFSDLLDEVEYYLDHSKFVGETLGDYHGAMTTRLKSFVNGYKGLLLNTQEHPDYDQMMNGRTIIELEGLADDADKCLVMGTILVQYFEYLKLHFEGDEKGLRHLMVIEEAHRLFKNVQKQQGGAEQKGADPTGQLVDTLSNIMAEIRAFGEGMMIVDQSPSKVAEDVIKNSSTKMIHRIDNEKDIKMLQSALLLRDDMTSIPMLAKGEALVRTEGMHRPCKVRMYLSGIKDDYRLSDSFQNGSATDEEMENAFAAMAVLSDDEAAVNIRSMLWLLFVRLEQEGFGRWKELMDEMMYSLIEYLTDKRKYDLVDGKAMVVRHLLTQAIRGMRNSADSEISVYELGEMHLFVNCLLDLYGDGCRGVQEREGNVRLLERFFARNLAALAYRQLEEMESIEEAE